MPALRITTHVPARFSSKSIYRNSPLTSLPSRWRFSVTLPFTAATLPRTCTSIGPSTNDSSVSVPDLSSCSMLSFVTLDRMFADDWAPGGASGKKVTKESMHRIAHLLPKSLQRLHLAAEATWAADGR